MNRNFAVRWLCLAFIFLIPGVSIAQMIKKMSVRGNTKVESDAILTILETSKGKPLDPGIVKNDIVELYELGYFSDIRFFKNEVPGGLHVIVEVKEKPAIIEIAFEGLSELAEEDFKDKLETRLYTIVNESTITRDLRVIEKQYLEKGYFLARATYKLENLGGSKHEVLLKYVVDEGGVVQVGDLFIQGNEYFSYTELVSQMLSKPITRSSTFSPPSSVYNEDFVKRDVAVTSELYKDRGFTEVEISTPDVIMDADRRYVRISFDINEGLQYRVGGIEISGDILYPKDEMKEWMFLKKGDLFRISRFRKDIEMLMDKYGDKGYAFVYVNPKHRYDRENKVVYLNYEIDKGEKVYFGDMIVIGNDKTRDNVIRRELEVADSELYSGTRLAQSKKNIERLGFFEEVQVIRKRDVQNPQMLNHDIKVKEKPTGQLQAAIGYSPGAKGAAENNWFGQGRYNEDNQSGYGWKSNVTGKWNGGKNYTFELSLTDPRVNDSYWSLGGSAFWKNEVTPIAGIELQEEKKGGRLVLGRRLFELVRGSVAYQYSLIRQSSDRYLIERFREDGIASSVTFSLSRNDTDNFLDPSEGTTASVSQKIVGGPLLNGERQYLESRLVGTVYYPIDYTETYRTYFKLHLDLGLLNQYENAEIPIIDRYRLGGYNNLRGFGLRTISPKFPLKRSPDGAITYFEYGGVKQFFAQLEYFFPLIPDANIKGLFFTDLGRVYSEGEELEAKGFYRDFGFGFRWITPIAPFRFEWAYPVIDGEVGDSEFIFSLGF